MNRYDIVSLILSPTIFAAVALVDTTYACVLSHLDFIVGVLTLVLGPVVPLILLTLTRKVDPGVNEREKRTPFLILAIVFYFLGYIYFRGSILKPMDFLMVSYVLVTSAVAILNAFLMKVSIHVAGVIGPAILLVLLGSLTGVLLLALAPIVAWARKSVGAHSADQMAMGALIAIAFTFLAFIMCRPASGLLRP